MPGQEIDGKLGEKAEFRLERQEVYDWVRTILDDQRGVVYDPEVLDAIRLLSDLEQLRSNRLTRSLVDDAAVAEVEHDLCRQTETGLVELSQGLVYYGGVQVIIVDDGGERGRIVDVQGIRADANNIAILVDSQGNEYPYTAYRELLILDGEESDE
ncbi:MAG TPA: hypothetical protein PKD19_04450 [Candidatus Saccharibacteria bacterium]|nr:hypothetical protein [Candidatus Saccharibacteria bacterium]HMR38764.1 hypothetical protein [Candidatus Saccharibacteria bacterium]